METKGILGKKLGMTQIFDERGMVIPVTAIKVGPCFVTQVKTKAKEGYSAIQLGFDQKREKNCTKPFIGHFKKNAIAPVRFLKEIRIEEIEETSYKVGDTIDLGIFEENQLVDISGTTIGKGFAGVMKRHNFSGACASHGTHEYFRHGGSVGMCATPARTWKGKKMPGQMGNALHTTQNLLISRVLPEEHTILIRGAIPGPKGGFVIMKPAVKAKKK